LAVATGEWPAKTSAHPVRPSDHYYGFATDSYGNMEAMARKKKASVFGP